MVDITKPTDPNEDPLAKGIFEEAAERHQRPVEYNAVTAGLLFEAWAAEQGAVATDATKEAYFEHCESLKAERTKLIAEITYPDALRDIKNELFDMNRAMTDEDYTFDKEISDAYSNVNFLTKDVLDEDAPDELIQLATEEIAAYEKLIEEASLKRSKSAGDIWARYPAARRRLAQAKKEAQENRVTLQDRVSEIEAQLPENTFFKDEDLTGPSSAFVFGVNAWNDAVRRAEYFNGGDTDCLPPHSAEPWLWDDEEWLKWWGETGETPPEGLFNDPVDDLWMDIGRLNDQVQWLKIQLSRSERLGEDYKGESEERFTSMNETIIKYNADRFKPQNGWHPSMEENIEILLNMGLEGQSVDVLFNRRDRHVQRDLVARWGVDIGFATRVAFKVSHYSHMNCFYGQLETHPNTTVLLGINIDRRNKMYVKTALRPLHEAEKWQYPEHKHIPGGVGFSKYTKNELLAAHRKMVDELYGKKANTKDVG